MDLLSIGIGFALGVIVYTLVIYLFVKKIKKQRLKEFEEKLKQEKEGELNNGFSIKNKEDKSN